MVFQPICFKIGTIRVFLETPSKGRTKTPTLPKTNIVPKNGGFQEESPFPGGLFSGAMLVSWRVNNMLRAWLVMTSGIPQKSTFSLSSVVCVGFHVEQFSHLFRMNFFE